MRCRDASKLGSHLPLPPVIFRFSCLAVVLRRFPPSFPGVGRVPARLRLLREHLRLGELDARGTKRVGFTQPPEKDRAHKA